ncbi:hypothetical protein A7C99_1472 [Trichophyton rubrum]|uniref:Uncharacterized protein n=1 Tax=Trichophyton rubrum TaxID=5551 RepID=A0A178F6H7_TRIRU|nr:hypothetical protein A7C99_1472 [Trichophyton rubrum]
MGSITKSEPSGRLLRGQGPPPTPTPTPQKLFNIVRQKILDAYEFQDLSFQNISDATGELVITSLSEDQDVENACPRINYNSYTQTLDIRVMPTFIHDAHQSWLVMEMSRMVSTGFHFEAFKGATPIPPKNPTLVCSQAASIFQALSLKRVGQSRGQSLVGTRTSGYKAAVPRFY